MRSFDRDAQFLKRAGPLIAILINGAILLSSDFALPAIAASSYRLIAASGQHAPGTSSTIVFGADDFGLPSLNEAGEAEFVSYLTGAGTDATNSNGIWVENGGVLQLAIRGGDPAPGTLDKFSTSTPAIDVKLNDSGRIAFFSWLTTSGGGANRGIWSGNVGNLQLDAQEAVQAPGLAPGDTFVLINSDLTYVSFGLNNAGHVAFYSQLAGGDTNGTNDEAIWTDVSGQVALAARKHDQVPGMLSGIYFDGGFGTLAFNDADQIGFYGRIAGTGVTSTNNYGVMLRSKLGGITMVARTGDQAPGTASGTLFSNFGTDPDLNNAGQMALTATLSGNGVTGANGASIWEGTVGNLHLVARSGALAPGAFNTFYSFDSPIINASGHVAFTAILTPTQGCQSCSIGSGVWSDVSGTLQAVAISGTHAPGLPNGVLFAALEGTENLAFNSVGQIAFVGLLKGTGVDFTNDYGLWATDSSGALHLIARTGDTFEVSPGDFRTISSLGMLGGSGNGDGRASGFNNLGQLAFGLHFTDGSAGAFVSNLVASVPEPCSTLLIAIGAFGLSNARDRRSRAA